MAAEKPRAPFRVEWVVEVAARSPFEAACYAMEIGLTVGHTATIFRVNGELIDVEGDEPSANGHLYGRVQPWATIDSAPRNGRTIDLWDEQIGRWTDMYWDTHWQAWARKEGYPVVTRIYRTLAPTYWCELPMGPDGSVSHG